MVEVGQLKYMKRGLRMTRECVAIYRMGEGLKT